ncbi:mitogen-activated protein kinase kinase kinase 4 isoform X2 [Daktulosphaira vitifoliae]|nr:mitogen-activated protein kinase kinase kinase 4 isoform X2 [Daktulosphaira vitifoliae]
MAIYSPNELSSFEKSLVDDQKKCHENDEVPLGKIKIETNNRFWSVGSKLVVCRKFISDKQAKCEDVNRVAFYDKLKRLANCEKSTGTYELNRQLSHEEELWQSELKDLIWLELRARITDRSITSQDKYLCEERKKIVDLLDEIINFSYRFNQMSPYDSSTTEANINNLDEETVQCWNRCGCLKLFCCRCIEQQNSALRKVEHLMERLEYAESLFPSSRAFAAQYPLYKSSEFTNRVEAMCVWYNITKRQRLMLLILGRHLMKEVEDLEPSSCVNSNNSPSTSNDSGKGSLTPSPGTSVSDKPEFKFKQSSANYREPISYKDLDLYNTQPIAILRQHFFPQSMVPYSNTGDASLTYRQFITGVLKTKGLRKALKFLDELYKNVLRKAHLTLKDQTALEDDVREESVTNDEELLRYSYWCKESKALNLPSYRAAFIFLSRIPLDLIHTYLRMRLDTRPEKPSIMSIRQLTCELKEGLLLAVVHRRRFVRHIQSTLWSDKDKDMKIFEERILHFDKCSKNVLEVYLRYMEEWVVMMEHCRAQKNILEEEWNDLKIIVPHIPDSRTLVTKTFCQIAKKMLETTAENFKNNILGYSKMLINVDLSHAKQNVLLVCRELQSILGLYREKALLVMSLIKTICKDLIEHFKKNKKNESDVMKNALPPIWVTMKPLKEKVFETCQRITEMIMSVEKAFNTCHNDIDDLTLAPRIRDVLQQMYKFAFEYHKEANRIACGPFKDQMAFYNVSISKLWINFVHERCERGRGLKPKWANTGLEFLLNVCEPQNIAGLSDEDFKDFKNLIEDCVMYIIGDNDDNSGYLSSNVFKKKRQSTVIEGKNKIMKTEKFSKVGDIDRSVRVMDAVNKLDHKLEERLRSQELIGHVRTTEYNIERIDYLRPRPVNFSWQRGIKIGQGRFGKVYTAVNNETGELMAMKEIQLQPFDHKAIRSVAVELKIFEGIVHENLVRYYGVEIHREEMVIFMELCAEGTLENLVAATENGLPEGLIRRFTKQLISGVDILHQHAIVHRDIKSANIFLTSEGNCLKLGDFGSAVKMNALTTVPGELKGFVGTQAYMAPEVFMKSNTDGHGRAADIWSVGCVVIEMASGKRPWFEYDSNYQIMFKVGMGFSPTTPEALCNEGQQFVDLCLKHDPNLRATTSDLLDHNFIKVLPEDCVSCRISSITMLEESLKLGLKR